MSELFSWHSPSSRLVVNAVLDTLASCGYDGLSIREVKGRAGAAGPGLDDGMDLDTLVVASLEHTNLFSGPEPTGNLREDLRRLLEPWRTSPSRDERAVAAVMSAASLDPRLKVAVHEALDRPLTQRVAALVTRARGLNRVSPQLTHSLCWVLHGLMVDRLRSGPRTPVDLEQLADFLITAFGIDGGHVRLPQPRCGADVAFRMTSP